MGGIKRVLSPARRRKTPVLICAPVVRWGGDSPVRSRSITSSIEVHDEQGTFYLPTISQDDLREELIK
jgi:hypothetical protein